MSPRAPARITNPAIYEDEEWRAWIADQCIDIQTLYSCLPPENTVIPEEGAWIIVRDVPFTALEFDVPRYSIWRARRFLRSRAFKTRRGGSRGHVNWPMMLAEIQTPGGDLVLYPTEYVVTNVEKWLDLIGEGVTVNFIGAGEPGELAAQMFYLQAHGIPRREALTLLLPSLADDRFAYLTLDVAA